MARALACPAGVPRNAAPCCAMPCRVTPRHAVPCRAMPCNGTPCPLLPCRRWRQASSARSSGGLAWAAMGNPGLCLGKWRSHHASSAWAAGGLRMPCQPLCMSALRLAWHGCPIHALHHSPSPSPSPVRAAPRMWGRLQPSPAPSPPAAPPVSPRLLPLPRRRGRPPRQPPAPAWATLPSSASRRWCRSGHHRRRGQGRSQPKRCCQIWDWPARWRAWRKSARPSRRQRLPTSMQRCGRRCRREMPARRQQASRLQRRRLQRRQRRANQQRRQGPARRARLQSPLPFPPRRLPPVRAASSAVSTHLPPTLCKCNH